MNTKVTRRLDLSRKWPPPGLRHAPAVCQANRMNPDVVKYGLDTEEVLVEELTT